MQPNPSASKSCKVEGCGANFPEKSFDWEKIHRSGSVPAVEKQRAVVAYVLNDQILSVGIVDVNRCVLHGHKIERGFVCVLVTYVKNKRVPAPIILGDREENRFLRKGMNFFLPIGNLFKCQKYIAGDKVVLLQYENSK